MARRLPASTEREIDRLLAHHWTYRAVASKLGVSTGAVASRAAARKRAKAPKAHVNTPKTDAHVNTSASVPPKWAVDLDSEGWAWMEETIDLAVAAELQSFRRRLDALDAEQASWPRCTACGAHHPPNEENQ